MLAACNDFLVARASGRNVLLVLLLAALWFAIFGLVLIPNFQAATNGLWPIDTTFPTTPELYFEQLRQYTPGSYRAYAWFAFLDYLYPPTMAAFFALLWAWLFRRAPRPVFTRLPGLGILFLPFAGALLDWLENAGSLLVIFSYPRELWGAARFAVACKQLKLAVNGTSALLSILFALIVVVTLIRGRATAGRG